MIEIVGSIVLVGLIALWAWIIANRRSFIWFKTYDEVHVVSGLLLWVAAKVPEPDGRRLRTIAQYTYAYPYAPPVMRCISRAYLTLLAPYIDEWIDGHLPPQDLPAEYEDYRPRTLLAFKQRLQAKGLWPHA
jgi:hypothetical protein